MYSCCVMICSDKALMFLATPNACKILECSFSPDVAELNCGSSVASSACASSACARAPIWCKKAPTPLADHAHTAAKQAGLIPESDQKVAVFTCSGLSRNETMPSRWLMLANISPFSIW
jgi:hypothetical protein